MPFPDLTDQGGFVLNNQLDALIIQIYSVIKFYMFRASSAPIIRSYLLYIRHLYASCRYDDHFLAELGWNVFHPESAWKLSPKRA